MTTTTAEKRGPGRPRSANKLTPAEKQARYRDRLDQRLTDAYAAERAAEEAVDAAERRADLLLDLVDSYDKTWLAPAVKSAGAGKPHDPLGELLAEHRILFNRYRTALAERNALYLARREATKARFKAVSVRERAG